MSDISPKGSKIIRICCDENQYNSALNDPIKFKAILNQEIMHYPELFPSEIACGYTLNGKTRASEKLGKVQFQKIRLSSSGDVYSIYPSFVMPNLIAYTDDVSNPLLLRKYNVPYSVLVQIFGKNEMFWYRCEKTFSTNSIVGTTVKKKEKLPDDIGVDEKHSSLNGDKIYIATTVAKGCVLGAEVCSEANEAELTNGYKVFKDESRNVDPAYSPKTINMDGWGATRLALATLFVSAVIIRCVLHAFIKIRDCSKKHALTRDISNKFWFVYRSKNKKSFAQRLRRFKDWSEIHLTGTTVLDKIITMHGRSKEYQIAYDHPDCLRTSNMCDRLMKFLDRALFDRQKFHGTLQSSTEMTHSWAILSNFYPYCQKTLGQKKTKFACPASELNGFFYSNNWLHNLVTSSSMNGYRR